MSTDPPVTDTQLRALLAGSLPDDEAARIEALLEGDGELRTRLDALSGASDFDVEFAPAPEPDDGLGEGEEDLSGIISSLKADPDSQAPSPTPSLVASILTPSQESGSIGSLGRYQIEGHLATGGMGVVYKARDPQLKRKVAIKVLSPAFAGHGEAMQRFLREATAAAAIEHPHVLPIHAIDTESAELPFLVLRYVDGPSVEKLIAEQNGPLEFEQVFAIAKAVASALAAAHAKDLTHRDIKPSNILTEKENSDTGTENQTIYLTDFGLAQLADDTALTRPGTFLGTPQFSSPEQARGEHVDHRSDLFSLGAVLYTMATGVSPFSGEDNSLTSVIYRVVHEPHPPAQGVNPALPAWFAKLVDQLLEKDPADRPQSAAIVMRCLEAESPEPLKARKPPRETLLISLLLLALLVISLLFLNPFTSDDDTAVPPPVTVGPADLGVTVIQDDDRHAKYESLADAIAAAETGNTIEISQHGKIPTPPLTIPPGKELTIRAAPDYHPVLHLGNPAAILLTAESPLVLEGLTLSADRHNNPGAPPLIVINADSFVATGCRFELPTRIRPRRRAFTVFPPIIKTAGTSRFRLLNCELVGAGSGGIRFLNPAPSGSSTIEIKNTLLVAYSGLELHGGAPDDATFEVEIDRNFISSRSPLVFFGAREAFPVTVSVTECLFTTDTTIVDTPLRIRDLFENVKWTERNNVYSTGGALARAGRRSGAAASGLLTNMIQWKTLFGTEVGGSVIHDLGYRTHIGNYLLTPTSITAKTLHEVPEPTTPLPTTGPSIDEIGPGEPYHRWRVSHAAAPSP